MNPTTQRESGAKVPALIEQDCNVSAIHQTPNPAIERTRTGRALQALTSFWALRALPARAAHVKRWAKSNLKTFMHRSSRISTTLSSHAERGGESVAGCAPFGLQRTIAAPRSSAARLSSPARAARVACEVLQAEVALFPTLGAASRFGSTSPRKPNPAFERTGQRPAAQGQR